MDTIRPYLSKANVTLVLFDFRSVLASLPSRAEYGTEHGRRAGPSEGLQSFESRDFFGPEDDASSLFVEILRSFHATER